MDSPSILTQDGHIVFSQYAQDPLEGVELFNEQDTELSKKIKNALGKTKNRKSKLKMENKVIKRNVSGHRPSFVINNEPNPGKKLIKIEIIDISSSSDQNPVNEENVLLSAQYVVKDGYDEIVDSTESVINKISKKLCGYSVSF